MKFKQKINGFTVIEVLVAVAIAAIAFLGVARFTITNTRQISVEAAKGRIEERVRITMHRFRNDIRYLGYDPAFSWSNAYIVTAGTEEFTFMGDIDQDDDLETITYQKNGDIFERAVDDQNGGDPLPLGTHLQSIAFSYYDVNNNITATLEDIRKIKVDITFQSEGIDNTNNPSDFNILSVSESFVPRNLLL